jgi:hypothetical protein
MYEKDALNLYRNLIKKPVAVDRNRCAPQCRLCSFHRPEFKYRRCLFAVCPYGKDDTAVFRRHPLRGDSFSKQGR